MSDDSAVSVSEMTEEETLALQLVASLAARGRREEIMPLLIGLCMAGAVAYENPNDFIDDLLMGINNSRVTQIMDGSWKV